MAVAQRERIVDDGLEVGVERRFAVAGEGYNIGRRAGGAHAVERLGQHPSYILTGIEAARAAVVGIPTALAIDTVETAQLGFYGQEVYPQRQSQTARMHRPEDYVVIERCHGSDIFCIWYFSL